MVTGGGRREAEDFDRFVVLLHEKRGGKNLIWKEL